MLLISDITLEKTN